MTKYILKFYIFELNTRFLIHFSYMKTVILL